MVDLCLTISAVCIDDDVRRSSSHGFVMCVNVADNNDVKWESNQKSEYNEYRVPWNKTTTTKAREDKTFKNEFQRMRRRG